MKERIEELTEELLAINTAATRRLAALARANWLQMFIVVTAAAFDVVLAHRLVQARGIYVQAANALDDATNLKMAIDAERRMLLDEKTKEPRAHFKVEGPFFGPSLLPADDRFLPDLK